LRQHWRMAGLASLPRQFVHRFACCFILLLMLASIGSCTRPANREEAISQVIAKGILRPGSTPGTLLFGPGILTQGSVAESTKPCEGAIGSIFPPFSLTQCVTYGLTAPLNLLGDVALAMKGATPPRGHVYLTGIEKFWVPQSEKNNCWAAVLETARKYLGLHYVSQDDLLESAQKICPGLKQQPGADAYQIVSAIRYRLQQHDQSRLTPGVCFDIQCVVGRLQNRRPVIMLGAGHAVLLVGLDFRIAPGARGAGPAILVERMFILDPNGNGQVETWSTFAFCKIDTFMYY